MPTSFRTPVVPPARRCARNPRSSPAQRSSARPIAPPAGAPAGAADDPAHERQPQTAVVARLRAEREQDVAQLTAAVDEPAEVAAGRAVLEIELDFVDVQTRPGGVDRHPHLAAEAGRERETGLARGGGRGR